jgi:murein DD-endopeptidase MepM/ murein hydrolase activator NlpD
VIIVPHTKANFIKFSFSTRSLAVGAACIGLAALLAAIAVAYAGSTVGRRAAVAQLEGENRELTDVNQSLEQTIAAIQGRLDDFEERTAQLALAAGMDVNLDALNATGGQGLRANAGGLYDRVPDDPETLLSQSSFIEQQLADVAEQIADQDQRSASTPTVAPVIGVITDGFGNRRDPFTGRRAFHRGLDISARRGTPIQAPADGVVVFAGRNGGMGKMVRVSHGYGYVTAYGHLDAIDVEAGDEVRRGDVIGRLGNTGRSTGPHLHYEVSLDGKAQNPLYYILDAY